MIQVSAVNREWNKLAAESPQAEKLNFVFKNVDDFLPGSESMQILDNGKRKYQNIKVTGITIDGSPKLQPLLKVLKVKRWTSVSFSRCEFNNSETLSQMLDRIEPFVEEFSVTQSKHKLRESTSASPKWTFPRLKMLDCDLKPITKLFRRCTNLVELRLRKEVDRIATRTLLYENDDLKKLTLHVDNKLLHPAFDTKCELRSLELFLGWPLLDRVLCSFLETHAQSLKALKADGELQPSCLQLVLTGMPRLTSFATRFFFIAQAILSWQQPFPVNTTITTLELKYDIRDKVAFESFLEALQGLKHFKCDLIRDETFDSLIRHASALESLSVKYFNVSRFPEGFTSRFIFPNIKTFTAMWFRLGLQEPTGDGHFAEMAAKAMRSRERFKFDWKINENLFGSR